MGLTAVAESRGASGWAALRELPVRRRAAVAALCTVLTAACFVRFGLTGRAVVSSFFAVVLVLLAAIDLDRRLIPNAIVLPATLIVLVGQIALFPDQTLEWVLASLGAALFFLIPQLVYPAGLGMGDVKLAALLGAGLGASVAVAIFVGLLAAAAFALILLVRGGPAARKKAFAFGPFLAFGGIVVLLVGGH